MGYDTHLLQKSGQGSLSMRLHGTERDETIKTIVKNVNEWVNEVNKKYTSELKERARNEQHQEEMRRTSEIKRLEREIEINGNINALLNELKK